MRNLVSKRRTARDNVIRRLGRYSIFGFVFALAALSGLVSVASKQVQAVGRDDLGLANLPVRAIGAASSWQYAKLGESFFAPLVVSVPVTSPASFHDVTPPGLPGLTASSTAWGDYDNDGLLDLLLTGSLSVSPYHYTRLFHNDGGGAFHDATPPGVPAVSRGTAAWGDYDNDGLIDFYLIGYGNSGPISKLYHNDGGGNFHDATPPGVRGAMDGTVSWADYDNDGRLDFLLGGFSSGSNMVQLYHNDGGGTFHNTTPAVLPPMAGVSVAWGDYDNDSLLDLLITGEGGTAGIFTKLYHNDGGGAFHDATPPGVPALDYGTVAWGDYNNDGLLDFFLKGSGAPGNISRIYQNDGGGAFHIVTQASLLGLTLGDAAWGDYDNDGLLDMVIIGSRSSARSTKLYHSSGGGLFEDVTPTDWPAVSQGSVAWGDYDNNGRLDLFLTGTDGTTNYITRLYHNDALLANTPPGSPGDLAASGVTTSSAVLNWSAATDPQTVPAGLGYNFRVGTAPGAADVVGPMANTTVVTQPDGLRRVVALGPARSSLTTTLRSLVPGSTYYWSVQAIDHAWAGGPFAAEGQFTTLGGSPTPTPSASNLVGHVMWQGIPQNDSRSVLPITLTLKLGATEVNYPQQSTDASGSFTVSVSNLSPGTYSWRAMAPDGVSGGNTGPSFLASCGQVTLAGAPNTEVELGTMRGGDTDNNNVVNATDFNIVKSQFGQSGIQPSDFNNDSVVNSSDFNILKGNFGQAGCGGS